MQEEKRIPYDTWINSQLSIARFSGGCKINGVDYVLDYDNCKTTGEGEDKKYFPDLIPFNEVKKKAKSKTLTKKEIREEIDTLFNLNK